MNTTTDFAGIPVMQTWRPNERHPVPEPSVGFLADRAPEVAQEHDRDQSPRAAIRVGDGRSPSFLGARIVRVLDVTEWTTAVLRAAEQTCEVEYEHAVRMACNPIGMGDLPDERVLEHAKRARVFKERAWRWGVLASQLRDGRELMQHHVDYLLQAVVG